MARRWLAAIALLLGAAWQPAPAAEADPGALLRDVSDRMLATLESEREEIQARPERLFEVVAEVLDPRVDLELMSRLVLGVHWRRAEPEQRERFMKAFRSLLVRFYTAALLEDPDRLDELLAQADRIITFQPARVGEEGIRALVRAEVHLPEGQDVPVSFLMHHRGDEWLVYDLTVEGVSLVTNYRNSFSQEIRQSSLEALIQRLEERSDEFLQRARQGSAAEPGGTRYGARPVPGTTA